MKNLSSKSITEISPAILPWLISLFLLVITAAVYAPVRHHEFINFDDGGYVYDNEHVQKGLTADSIKWAFTLVKPDEKSYWHPVTWLSHMLDCQLFGLDAGYHHLSNVFYHLLNVLLLFYVLYRMTGAVWKSAAVAALFALHPVNVDSVAWIAERKNLLSTTFWMLTMLAYIRYAAKPSVWRYVLIIIVFTLGLMAKPMLVTLPCALLLLDFWPLYRFKWFNEHWFEKTEIRADTLPHSRRDGIDLSHPVHDDGIDPSHPVHGGGFDPLYPVYDDEVDLSHPVRRGGVYPRPGREGVKPSPTMNATRTAPKPLNETRIVPEPRNETRTVPEPLMASITRLIAEKIPLLFLSFGAIWLSFLSLRSYGQIRNAIEQPLSLRIENALVSYIHYLWQMIWPAKLAVFYPFPASIPLWQSIAATIVIIGMTILVVTISKRKPYLAIGWFWYIGTLTPVIGIIQGGLWPQIADRWAYVPFIGIFIILAWGVSDITSRFKIQKFILAGISAATLLIMAALTITQLTYWKNSDILFQHTLNVTRDNYFAHTSVGQYFSGKGNHSKAIWHFQKALEIQPEYSKAHGAISETYIFLKDYDIDSHNQIGKLFVLMGKHDQAIQYFSEAIALDPDHPSGYNNLGAAYYFRCQLGPAMDNLGDCKILKYRL